jgi:hypothetical protein
MKRFYLHLMFLSILFSGCEIYFVDRPYQQSNEEPIEEPIMYPVYYPAPPPQPPYNPPIDVPTAPGTPTPVHQTPKSPSPPRRSGSDIHTPANRNDVSETRTAPTLGRTTEPTNTSDRSRNSNNAEQNTQNTEPARSVGGRR